MARGWLILLMEVTFPLTPALSLGERGLTFPVHGIVWILFCLRRIR